MSSKPTILTCTDGSRYAASVYDHAAWAARQTNGRVHVLHVIDARQEAVPYVDLSGSIGVNARAALKEELVRLDEARGRAQQAKAALILEDAKAHLTRANLSEVKTEARHGTLVESLEEYESRAALVVIGKRGESADFAKMHLGANLERVIRASQRPVLVASRAFKPIEQMLIAYDGGRSARKAVEYAASQSLLRGIQCRLLAVGRPSATIEEDLKDAADALRASGYSVETQHERGHPEEVIAEAVKAGQIDLLVMGAYGHSRIRQLVVGSTTTTMVRTCLVPVLMFR